MNLKLRVAGIILTLLGLTGFLTIADDLRHKGELLGVGSILMGGLILLAVSLRLSRRGREQRL